MAPGTWRLPLATPRPERALTTLAARRDLLELDDIERRPFALDLTQGYLRCSNCGEWATGPHLKIVDRAGTLVDDGVIDADDLAYCMPCVRSTLGQAAVT